MIEFKNKNVIFWDFDGVLIDSMPVRNQGFRSVLEEFPKDQVDLLMKYHLENGGLSRYVKFRYFFEEIVGRNISEEEIVEWTSKFSNIMRKKLLSSELLIKDTIQFIRLNDTKFAMHIVSGSDENELRFLCDKLGIKDHFKSIHGSPTPKAELVKKVLTKENYDPAECVLIGDSKNDYDAAMANNIDFLGYNNPLLRKFNYLESLS